MGFEIKLTINSPVTTLSGINIATGAFIYVDIEDQTVSAAQDKWYFYPKFYANQTGYDNDKAFETLELIHVWDIDMQIKNEFKEYEVAIAGSVDVDTVEKCKLLVASAVASELGIDSALIS